MESPPYRGSIARRQPFDELTALGGSPLFIAPPSRGLMLTPSRYDSTRRRRLRAVGPPAPRANRRGQLGPVDATYRLAGCWRKSDTLAHSKLFSDLRHRHRFILTS